MPFFLIHPKTDIISSSPISTERITAAQRIAKLEEVTQAWQENHTYQAIQSWVEQEKDSGVTKIDSPMLSKNLIGLTLVEMEDAQAAKLAHEFNNIVVLKDQELELISPIEDIVTARDKVPAITKDNIKEQDLWHLGAIRKQFSQKTGKGIKIVVFDTGVDPKHPEIAGKVTKAYEFLNHRPGDIQRVDLENYADTDDIDGHGTHIAGLICGNNVGVAPGAEIVSFTMVPNSRGRSINFILALNWLQSLHDNDIRIVNISSGLSNSDRQFDTISALTNELLDFDILPICAVGNKKRNNPITPGDCPSVISVGASDRNGKVPAFSSSARKRLNNNTEYNVPSLVAPGDKIYSSIPGGLYKPAPGSSMATAIVSGVAALILEANPQMSAYELREELLRSCELLEELPERQGKGIIQVKV